MQRRYITVDVFTDRAFGGNPLAVVLDAGGLSTAQMQAIATEFNYSETTFVLPPRDADNDAEVRIFTVNSGDPVCRPSQCRHGLRAGEPRGQPPPRLMFEEGAGHVPVAILKEAGKRYRGRTHRAAGPAALTIFTAEQAAGCVSLPAGDIRIERHPPGYSRSACRF